MTCPITTRRPLTAKQIEAADKRHAVRRKRVPAHAIEHDPGIGDGSAYFTWHAPNALAVVFFRGRWTTQTLAYSFPTQARADEYISSWVEDLRIDAARVAELRQRHSLQVGAILFSCWGYEQTNIGFYQVVAVRGAVVDLRELAKERTPTGDMSANVLPKADAFIGSPVLGKRPSGHNTIAVDGYRLYPWEGQALSETSYA
jgi:hypothetical protein